MYDGTSTEQKTKNAKSIANLMFAILLQSFRVRFIAPISLYTREAQIGWFVLLAWFRGFIDSMSVARDYPRHGIVVLYRGIKMTEFILL